MKYVLDFYFRDKPECIYCMLSYTKRDCDYATCMGLGLKCPEEGCRKDCPLKLAEE